MLCSQALAVQKTTFKLCKTLSESSSVRSPWLPQDIILCIPKVTAVPHKYLGTCKNLSKIWYDLPLSLRKTRCCCAPAIQTSRVVGLTDGTTVAGSKMVSSPLVTVPSDGEISAEFRVHVVLGFTAPSNRHLKHVCTPPSTVSTVPPEMSTQPVCELTVEMTGKKACDYEWITR